MNTFFSGNHDISYQHGELSYIEKTFLSLSGAQCLSVAMCSDVFTWKVGMNPVCFTLELFQMCPASEFLEESEKSFVEASLAPFLFKYIFYFPIYPC